VVTNTFESYRDYFNFVWAKGFYNIKRQEQIQYPSNFLEKAGRGFLAPAFVPLDQLLQNIKNPLVITALTVTAIAIVTIAFYPATSASMIGTLFPFIFKIQPWMLKFAVFAAVELNILGIGIRTLGRLCNAELMQAWTRREVIPISIGAQVKF
jgi:hypothetical protein